VGQPDAVIVGGGVIGLSAAWLAARDGLEVVVVDPTPGNGASWAAAGMLAPVTEVHYNEEALLELNLRAAEAWPAFAAELEDASGLDVGYRPCGTLAVAADAGDRAVLEDLHRFQLELGLASTWCGPAECRRLEGLLSPRIRGGVLVPGDHQADPRRLVRALVTACELAGVTLVDDRVERVLSQGARVRGVATVAGSEILAASVVLAAGAWMSSIGGLPNGAMPPIRPVKGQILRLRFPPDLPLPERNIRGIVQGSSLYLVPRLDGELVCGATVEERGEDRSVTAGAVYTLLRDAQAILPALAEAELVETGAGLRPGTPDNAPYLGKGALDGLVIASGHYRNGILLAPVSASVVAAVLAGKPLPPWAVPFSPDRNPGP
jgi:glycine oxidase